MWQVQNVPGGQSLPSDEWLLIIARVRSSAFARCPLFFICRLFPLWTSALDLCGWYCLLADQSWRRIRRYPAMYVRRSWPRPDSRVLTHVQAAPLARVAQHSGWNSNGQPKKKLKIKKLPALRLGLFSNDIRSNFDGAVARILVSFSISSAVSSPSHMLFN